MAQCVHECVPWPAADGLAFVFSGEYLQVGAVGIPASLCSVIGCADE